MRENTKNKICFCSKYSKGYKKVAGLRISQPTLFFCWSHFHVDIFIFIIMNYISKPKKNYLKNKFCHPTDPIFLGDVSGHNGIFTKPNNFLKNMSDQFSRMIKNKRQNLMRLEISYEYFHSSVSCTHNLQNQIIWIKATLTNICVCCFQNLQIEQKKLKNCPNLRSFIAQSIQPVQNLIFQAFKHYHVFCHACTK